MHATMSHTATVHGLSWPDSFVGMLFCGFGLEDFGSIVRETKKLYFLLSVFLTSSMETILWKSLSQLQSEGLLDVVPDVFDYVWVRSVDP